MSVPARYWVPVEEYLAQEALAVSKSEYFDGEIFAMAGAGLEHNLIAANVVWALRSQLENSPCRVVGSDQRVAVPETGLYTYPDVTVVCEEPEVAGPGRSTLLNPTLIVEVLSESTGAYDRGDKFAHYRRLSSLREYVLIASDRRRIERFTRQVDGTEWVLAECSDAAGALALPSMGCVLSLPEVYRKVEFPQREPGAGRAPGSPKD